MGWFTSSAGAGKKPLSVPICSILGPAEAGSGTPPARPSVGQVDGYPIVAMAGTIGTSPALASAKEPFVFHMALFDLEEYNCKFQNRSLLAFNILNLYALGYTSKNGYAVPLIKGVSMKASGTSDTSGVPGFIGGSSITVGYNGLAFGPFFNWVYGGQNHGP